MRITGKVIVVVGGGNGIGRQVVLEVLRRGARVAAVDVVFPGAVATDITANSGVDAPVSRCGPAGRGV